MKPVRIAPVNIDLSHIEFGSAEQQANVARERERPVERLREIIPKLANAKCGKCGRVLAANSSPERLLDTERWYFCEAGKHLLCNTCILPPTDYLTDSRCPLCRGDFVSVVLLHQESTALYSWLSARAKRRWWGFWRGRLGSFFL